MPVINIRPEVWLKQFDASILEVLEKVHSAVSKRDSSGLRKLEDSTKHLADSFLDKFVNELEAYFKFDDPYVESSPSHNGFDIVISWISDSTLDVSISLEFIGDQVKMSAIIVAEDDTWHSKAYKCHESASKPGMFSQLMVDVTTRLCTELSL